MNAVLGNWEVDLIQKITSGFPVFVITSNNQSGSNFQFNGSGVNRPDQICSGHLDHPTISQWFDTQCFVQPAPGKLGNGNRTAVYGPGFVNTDFSAIKHFPLPYRDGMMLDFRAEFFNLTNHPNFGQPNGFITPAGVIVPRSFSAEFGAQFRF